jgi:hypothetical protein
VAQVVKVVSDPLTEELLRTLVGEYVHGTKNGHDMINPTDGSVERHNVWFAGQVAGYEKAEISFDWQNEQWLDVPQVFYNLLMTDGTSYLLSQDELEISIISEYEFTAMLANYQTNEAIRQEVKDPSNIILADNKKILVPGKDF